VSVIRDGELETGVEISRALEGGQVLCVELLERALERAEAWQPAINAFTELWPERAVELARRVDALPRPEWRPIVELPLLFMPIAVKDLYDVAGYRTTGCCAAYRDNVRAEDSAIVARLREAEVIMIGKTNQHELAAGGTNSVSACGRTGNPWAPDRITGGSSGGSAAAVAAGIVPLALGSDTGGSIRIPAALCGTFGLKPTTGQLPTAGMMPLAPSLDCPGPIAATVADLQLLYRAMGEPPQANGGSGTSPRGLRIGVPDGYFAKGVHPDVLAVVAQVQATFASANVAVEPVDGHGIEDARLVWMGVCTPEFFEAHPALRDRRDQVSPSVLAWLDQGERMSEQERADARRRRSEIARWFRDRLEGFDALLIPTTPYPAPRSDDEHVDLGHGRVVGISEVSPGRLTCSVNLAGLPSLSLPAGRSSEGLPIGVSLVGSKDADGMLLRLAAMWEEAAGYRPQRPHLPV
jgi:aspartyl-tRNA(Asn)/glutamyl-tRNA(Gln) amidotransferase subunit A